MFEASFLNRSHSPHPFFQVASQEQQNTSSDIDRTFASVRVAKTGFNFSKKTKIDEFTLPRFPSLKGKSLSPQRPKSPRRQDQILQKKYCSSLKQNGGIHQITNQDLVRNVTHLNSLIYILGSCATDLIDILEQQEKREKEILELIEQMKSNEFLESQQHRMQKIGVIYQTFFVNNLMNEGENKDINKEITSIIYEEFNNISKYYRQYISSQEAKFKKINIFQDKEIILLTDFYEALHVLMDTYNFYFKELEVYGKTKQEYNVYVKSLFQFKGLLKSDSKNEKASMLFEELEQLLKSNFEKVDLGMIKIQKLTQENQELTKMCIELQKARSEFSHTIISLQKEKEQGETKGSNQIPESSSIKMLEEYYSQLMENLKNDNKRLNEQIIKQNKKIQLLANSKEISTQEDKIKEFGGNGNSSQPTNTKASEDLKNKIKQYYSADKQVQCTFVVDKNPIQKKENDISHILQQPLLYLKSATVQSKEWALMITNAIFSDKFVSDIYDEQDLRPPSPFNLFVCEWFLKKFGNKDIAESLLKDYLISLKKYGRLNERFKMFCEICGLDEIFESDIDPPANSYSYNPSTYATSIGINRQRFKKIYMRTSEGLIILFKVAYLVRILGKNYFGQNSHLPLFPNILQRCLDLVPSDYSLRIWETIATEENLNKLDLSSLESKFKRIVQQDLVQRSNDPLGVYQGVAQEQEDGHIRFDTLSRCIFETIIDQRFFELEGIYSALKLKANPRYECFIGFTEFSKILAKTMPKKSQRWIEISYREFCQGVITEKTPLNVAVMRLIPFIVNEDCIKQNFLKIRPPRSQDIFSLPPPSPPPVIEEKQVGKSGSNASQSKSKSSRQSITQMNRNSSKAGNSIANNSITNSPQKKIVAPSAPVFDMVAEQQKFKEKINQVYDCVTQMGLLEETYKMMYPLIKQLEKKNQNLQNLHTSIKEDFASLPNTVVKQIKYDQFQDRQKEELLNSIEAAWEKFRKILASTTKQ